MNEPERTVTTEPASPSAPSGTEPLYSVVIPVYRSAEVLPELLRQLDDFFDEHRLHREIIFVNDGSPDDSWNVLERIKGERDDVIAIDLLRNYGQHSALFCGLQHARGDFVITMDDDLQNPPAEIIHLIDKAREGYDVVFGKFRQKMHGPMRRIASRVIGWLNEKLFQKPPELVLTNFRILTREVVDSVSSYRTSFPYIPGLVLLSARTFANVPVEHKPRPVGRSTYTLAKLVGVATRLVINYSAFPLRLLCAAGGLSALVAFVIGLYYLVRAVLVGSAVPGWTTLVVLLSFYQGVMLALFAAVGEYLVRIASDVSGQRAYRVRKKL